jgi:ankyrin repeat protein
MNRLCLLLILGLWPAANVLPHEDDPDVTYEHRDLRGAAKAAVWSGNKTLLDALLKAGLQINKPVDPEDGQTVLHTAVSARNPDMIRHLLAKGADPLAMDFYGDKPVDELERCEDKKELTECLTALKREPADYDLKKLNDIPAPVWREVLGVPAKTPDPLAPPRQRCATAAGDLHFDQ